MTRFNQDPRSWNWAGALAIGLGLSCTACPATAPPEGLGEAPHVELPDTFARTLADGRVIFVHDAYTPPDTAEPIARPAPPLQLSGSFTDIPVPLTASEFPVHPGSVEEEFKGDLTVGLMGDLDGDGYPEVIVSNFDCCPDGKKSRALRYDRDAGRLVFAPELLPPEQIPTSLLSGIIDMDGDGHVDLVRGSLLSWCPSDETGKALGCFATPIVWGDGEGGFIPGGTIPKPDGSTLDRFVTDGNVHLTDLDSDGWMDMLVSNGGCADDSTSVNPLLRTGPRSYASRTDLLEATWPSASSAIAILAMPMGPDEMVISAGGPNCDYGNPFAGFFQLDGLDKDGFPTFSAFDPTPLESVYKAAPDVSFGPLSVADPMGAVVTDMDLDGLLDYAVTLRGFYAVFQGRDRWPFRDRTSALLSQMPLGNKDLEQIPWGIAMPDIDRDGFPDMVVVHGDEYESVFNTQEEQGLQFTRVLRNKGGFQFEEITTGLETLGNWRALTIGDLDKDGDPDIIVGGHGMLPRVYRNDVVTPYKGLAIQLVGTTSNHLGVGARVEVLTADEALPQLQVMGAMISPLAMSEPMLFYGLGGADEAVEVRVTWPSGLVHEVQHFEAGKVHIIEEPPTITLSEPDRHVPADGSSTVEVVVTPRFPDGAVNFDSEVTIEAAFGHEGFGEPTPRAGDGTWARTLTAPTEVGSTVIEVHIDGTPLRVRPRIWWDDPN